MTLLPRLSKNVQEIEAEKEELELSLQAKTAEIEKLKDKCFEMEEEQHILQVRFLSDLSGLFIRYYYL